MKIYFCLSFTVLFWQVIINFNVVLLYSISDKLTDPLRWSKALRYTVPVKSQPQNHSEAIQFLRESVFNTNEMIPASLTAGFLRLIEAKTHMAYGYVRLIVKRKKQCLKKKFVNLIELSNTS